MRAVPVVRVGAVQPLEAQVGVLVGFGLARLDVVAGRLGQRRVGYQRAVAVIAVEGYVGGRVLQLHRTLRDRVLDEAGRQRVGRGEPAYVGRRGDRGPVHVFLVGVGRARGQRDGGTGDAERHAGRGDSPS